MNNTVEIVTVTAANIETHGFFCYKSKRKSPGYEQKLAWLQERFAEGMQIQIVYEGGYEDGRSVGFIESIPGEYSWRALNADDYLVIHCIWVVGRGKGYGSQLLANCESYARKLGKHGVATVTSRAFWLIGNDLLLKHGYESVDRASPSFELLVKRFDRDDQHAPTFPQNWQERLDAFGPGLTVTYSHQCPYINNSVRAILATGDELGIPTRAVLLTNSAEVREIAPSPFGLFNVIYNGKLLAYHPIDGKTLVNRLYKIVDKSEFSSFTRRP